MHNVKHITVNLYSLKFVVVVQLLSHVQLFATPWTGLHQATLSFTISQSLLRFMSTELVMSLNHLILCHPLLLLSICPSFPCGSDGKESACSAGELGLSPGFRRSPGEGNGNPLQYSCLENLTDGGVWQVTPRGVTKSPTGLSN